MKKSILMILSVLTVAVLAVSFSGCLGADDKPNTTEPITNPAAIQAATLYTDGNNVMAQIVVQIHGTHSQSLDKDNVTVNVSGNTVNVNVPVVNSSSVNTKDLGYETVEVVLGTKDQFKDGDYTLIINGKTDKTFESKFKFTDGQLYSYKPATIEGIVIEVADGKVVVNSTVTLAGSAETVDEKNITVTGTLQDNDVVITIPAQVKDGPTTLNLIWKNVVTEIGQLDGLADGTYKVTVNGIESTFTIQNNRLITGSE